MFRSFRQRGIDPDDIEKALSQFCARPAFDKKANSQPSISDSTFKSISQLLKYLETHHHVAGWSDRPRTYTVLRNINRLDLFRSFIELGLNDIAFPYTIEKVPDLIQEDGLRDRFLRHQNYILTTAIHLEDGRHALTKDGEDLYRLVRHLGRGGFGSVDEVWSRMSFRTYARKKFLRKTSSKADQKILMNFENELTNLKRLSHEHLVKVIGSYTDQKSVAFLMEPVADMNLLMFLDSFSQDRESSSPSLRSYFGCLANAVAYLHTQRIKHRDLKPANILIKDFKVYIADFGTARDWSLALNDTTTDSGVPVTPAYMAPEVAHRSPRNSAADMWSLGVVFLDMLTVLRGQSLFKMRRFIANHGTKHPYVYANGSATTQWFEELRLHGQGPVSDNEPLSWIKDLTQIEPQRRPKPWALASQIRSSVSSTAFIGICCADEAEIEDYPSPPLTATSEEETTLQEQLEALGIFEQPGISEKPYGSYLKPQKQSSLQQWRDDVHSDTAPLYTTTLWDDNGSNEPYQSSAEGSNNAEAFDAIVGGFVSHMSETRDHTTVESCYGYEIAEDDSDDENKIEETGYEITEDSSGSERTICPSSPQLLAEPSALLSGQSAPPHPSLPPGSLSATAILEELDMVPEVLDPSEPVPPNVAITSATATPITSATTDVPVSHWLPWYPTLSEPTTGRESTMEDRSKTDQSKKDRGKTGRTKANRTVSFMEEPVLEKGEALTADNLSRLVSGTSNAPTRTDDSRRADLSYDTKPKMTAGLYMQEVWEAASTVQTSVLDAKTQKAFARLGPGIVWQDRTQQLVESYAKQGKAAAVRELLRAGCNPGTMKKPRWRPLLEAVKAGTPRHNKVVRILLEHGADVNVKNPFTGKTSLHYAIENPYYKGYTNIIRTLLEHGADANALDKSKDSALLQILYGGYKALEKHKRDALACLLQDHIDVNVNVTPLGTLDMPIHLAVRRKDAIAVAILVHRGSRVNDPNSTGLTPLRIAASSWSETSPEDDMEILKYLLQGGANINETTGDAQSTVLEMAARQGCLQAVKLLLSNAHGSQRTPMCQAAADAAIASKSKMSEKTYNAIFEALKSAQAPEPVVPVAGSSNA
ncbi:MAG: hypothetical protein Q9169_000009 [Polycauliona sp. 2 TL-2023]